MEKTDIVNNDAESVKYTSMEIAVVFKDEEFLIYDCKKKNW